MMAFVTPAPLFNSAFVSKRRCLQACTTDVHRHTSSVRTVAKLSRPSQQEPPPPISIFDTLSLFADNIRRSSSKQLLEEEVIPVADVAPADFVSDTPFFINLDRAYREFGPIYQLIFGPKLFVILQHPSAIRSVLRDDSILYDKGVLAEVLDEIMGKGLIPADYETWKVRRRAIAPGFHNKWLSYMTTTFGQITLRLCEKLAQADDVRDMEAEFCSLALDVVGSAVFNFEFESISTESPVIKAVYRILKETEHRSTAFIPYWKIPGARKVVPRLKKFYADMDLVNDTLDVLIAQARDTATATDLDDLQKRDYENVTDPSLLRFLVELRGDDVSNKQLRDDLITLLIAGHETVAAVLTWTFYELAKNTDVLARAREEVDVVLGDRLPTFEDIVRMPYLRRVMAEGLRLYPAPPVLIRRLLADTPLPDGCLPEPVQLKRGTDIFINVYSLHRSPELWEEPDLFNPDRWLHPFHNPAVKGWNGYIPSPTVETGKQLYPSESHADFAFLPFGGGNRKCVGDSFATLEAVTALAMIIRRFDFRLNNPSEDVQMTTGATIHTKEGLNMRLVPRELRGSTDTSVTQATEVLS